MTAQEQKQRILDNHREMTDDTLKLELQMLIVKAEIEQMKRDYDNAIEIVRKDI